MKPLFFFRGGGGGVGVSLERVFEEGGQEQWELDERELLQKLQRTLVMSICTLWSRCNPFGVFQRGLAKHVVSTKGSHARKRIPNPFARFL